MISLIVNKSKTVYECLDKGEAWHCYGFYFQLDLKILEESVFCFIGDPDKLKTMYDKRSTDDLITPPAIDPSLYHKK